MLPNILTQDLTLLNENISGLIRGITSDTQIIFLNFIRPCMEVIKEFSVLIF